MKMHLPGFIFNPTLKAVFSNFVSRNLVSDKESVSISVSYDAFRCLAITLAPFETRRFFYQLSYEVKEYQAQRVARFLLLLTWAVTDPIDVEAPSYN